MSGKPLKSALKRNYSDGNGHSSNNNNTPSPSSTKVLQQQMPPTPPLTLTPSPSPLPIPTRAPAATSTSLLEQFGATHPANSSFFDAVIPQLNEFHLAKTENELREEISKHLEENFEHYYGDLQDYMNDFGLKMPTPSLSSSEDLSQSGNARRSSKPEHWTPYEFTESLKNGKVDADLEKCPEALSHLYQATVVIFQSNQMNVFKTSETTERVICLSYQNETFKRVVISNDEKAKELAEKIENTRVIQLRVSEPVRKKTKK